MLHKKLNYHFKKKDEQEFIHSRLNLLEQYYCLDVEIKLWQFYLDMGLQEHQWPVSFPFK